jgi:hypothetical protein
MNQTPIPLKPLLLALLPALATGALWLVALLVYRQACPDWCLTCTQTCVIGETDLGWLMVYGLLLGPYLLCITAPLSAVLLAVVFLRRRTAPA